MRPHLGLFIVLITVLISCASQSDTSSQQVVRTTIMPRSLTDMQPKLTKTLTPQAALQVFGTPDEITGSGLLIYVYTLANGQQLRLGFSGQPLFYAKVQNKDGSTIDMPLK